MNGALLEFHAFLGNHFFLSVKWSIQDVGRRLKLNYMFNMVTVQLGDSFALFIDTFLRDPSFDLCDRRAEDLEPLFY